MSLPRTAIVASLIVLGSCSRTGTSLLIEIDASTVPGVEQFHIVGRDQDGLVFGPTVRPEAAAGPLEGKQTLRVLLRDEVAGTLLTVRVDGLIGGQSTGFGEVHATPEDHRELVVPVTLELSPPACARCDGCCDRQQCISGSVAACGAGGVGCFECDPITADRCSPTGRCACGMGPACVQLLVADRCIDGLCHCGTTGKACDPDQVCQNGLCVCTQQSCPTGCCSRDNRCMPGDADTACGEGGSTCMPCSQGQNCTKKQCTPAPVQ
jgi:hypothetical protein